MVVNPTHIAIALRYRPGEDRAPRVTAKGKGEQAEKIRELAREHGIPIVENIPLARLLYRRVKVGARCRPRPSRRWPPSWPSSTGRSVAAPSGAAREAAVSEVAAKRRKRPDQRPGVC